MKQKQAAEAAISELHAKSSTYCQKLRIDASNADAQRLYFEFLQYVADWRKKYNNDFPLYPLPLKKIKCQLGLFGEIEHTQLTPQFAQKATDKISYEIDTDFNNIHNGQWKL